MKFIDWKEKMNWSETYSDQIIKKLFQPEERRHKQICEDFLKKNNEILGENRDGFRYMGKAFLAAYNAAPLATELVTDFSKHLAYWNQVQRDQQYIKQILVNLLKPCVGRADVRDALPECLVSFFPELQGIARTREHGWTLKDKPMLYRQYINILPKIEMYYATSLIY